MSAAPCLKQSQAALDSHLLNSGMRLGGRFRHADQQLIVLRYIRDISYNTL